MTALSSRSRLDWVLPSFMALVLFVSVGASSADDGDAAAALPLDKVVLFSSGVGFFEHEGEVTGDASVDMQFNVDDVNDLLKSMVVQDLGGGRAPTVSYGSRDPITHTLRTFAIDLTENPTLADLLQQVRGEQVELDAPTKITGTIVGVERRAERAGDETITVEYLTLLTPEGLRSVPLSSVGRIKLTSESLDAELRQALAVLALGHSTDKKSVTLNFHGADKRPVRVGYIQASPIWKTSYRLVLDDDEQPFLQGWAIVENTTESDWKDVSLALVSGRPISFVMDLYEPLYVQRPVVEPELFASLRPQRYGQDMQPGVDPENFAYYAKDRAPLEAAPPPAPAAPQEGKQFLGRMFSHGGDGQAGEEMSRAQSLEGRWAEGESMAQAADIGELFQYTIDTPVTLARRRSAMLPIVNASVTGDKVSIYNEAVQAKHPLNGLKLRNTTGLHLMQGPITVFDGGAYAGDAQIEDVAPGGERLVSYAVDLNVEVAPDAGEGLNELLSVKLHDGLLTSSRKHERSRKYAVKSSAADERRVLVEYPLDENWKLLAPKEPTEKTRNMYRFAVDVAPGKSADLVVKEQRVLDESVQLLEVNDDLIAYYVQQGAVSDAVKQALTDLSRRRAAIAELERQKGQLEEQIRVVGEEQARIRENMTRLDRNTELYQRYVKKFAEQEDQVERNREQIVALQQRIDAAQKELGQHVAELTVS